MTASAGSAPWDRIVVFGTSLSDPGNYFVLHPNNAVPPYTSTVNEFLVPSYAYATGGHHLSNGPTWIEQLALGMGLGSSVQPALSVTEPAFMPLMRLERATTGSTSICRTR